MHHVWLVKLQSTPKIYAFQRTQVNSTRRLAIAYSLPFKKMFHPSTLQHMEHQQPKQIHTYPVHGEAAGKAVGDAPGHEHHESPVPCPKRPTRVVLHKRPDEVQRGRYQQLSSSAQETLYTEANHRSHHGP